MTDDSPGQTGPADSADRPDPARRSDPADRPGRSVPDAHGGPGGGWARYHPAFLVLLSFAALGGVARLVFAIAGGLGWFPVLVSVLILALLSSGVGWQLRLMRREERQRNRGNGHRSG